MIHFYCKIQKSYDAKKFETQLRQILLFIYWQKPTFLVYMHTHFTYICIQYVHFMSKHMHTCIYIHEWFPIATINFMWSTPYTCKAVSKLTHTLINMTLLTRLQCLYTVPFALDLQLPVIFKVTEVSIPLFITFMWLCNIFVGQIFLPQSEINLEIPHPPSGFYF